MADIADHYCGQAQPHGAHVWRPTVPLGSTAISTPRQCAGATGEVPPGPCWHDSGVSPFGGNPARTIRCDLLAGHAGAHESKTARGGTVVWTTEEADDA